MPPRPVLTRLQTRALDYVAESCANKLAARAALKSADELFRFRVVAAAELGCSYEQIAQAAGISKGRVGQIVKAAKQDS